MEENIDDICKRYGASLLLSQFNCTIMFKDGKELVYAMNNQCKTVDSILRNAKSIMLSNAHGRIFKDGKFIGYAPAASSIDELLVAVDLML